MIDENPFSEVTIPTANVSARQRFIDRDRVQKLLDAARPTWRTIIALGRFGELRWARATGGDGGGKAARRGEHVQ